MSLSLQSVCVCVCAHRWRIVFSAHSIFALTCTRTSTYVYIHSSLNDAVLTFDFTFSFQVKIEGISLLLTQLATPSGGIKHHPVRFPSKESPGVHTNDRGQGNPCDSVTAPTPGGWRSSVLLRPLYMWLVAVLLLEL